MSLFAQLQGVTVLQWTIIALTAFVVGFSKTGIGGVSLLIIPVLAAVFGGKDSTGILLPILLVGDVFALLYYHRSANWKEIVRPMPATLAGLVLGALVGNYISDTIFIRLIGIIILICLTVFVYMEKKKESLKVPDSVWFSSAIGVLCGFFSMLGNAAGPIFSIYLLALGYAKGGFMGTSSWFFFIINFIKMPLQIFVWHNITLRTLVMTVPMIPAVAAGAILGAFVLKKINEKYFRYIVMGMTALAAVKLLI